MTELDQIMQGVPRLKAPEVPYYQVYSPEIEPEVAFKKKPTELDTIMKGVPRLEGKADNYGPEELWQDEPDALGRIGRMFKDPEKEGAKAVQALVDAEMNNITPSQAMKSGVRKEIDKGNKINPARAKLRGDATTLFKQNLQIGFAQVNLGLWGYKVLLGDDSPETWDAIRKTQAAMPKEEERPYAEGLGQEVAGSTGALVPFLYKSFEQGSWRALILSGGTWLMGTVTRTEAITYPLIPTMYAIGQTAGSLEFVGKVEGGMAVIEFMDYEDPKTGEKINPQEPGLPAWKLPKHPRSRHPSPEP